MAKDGLFFIQVQDPKNIRKNLLDSSQQIVEAMKSYENYKSVKVRKLQEIDKLKKTTASIKELAGKVRSYLPTIRGKPDTKKKEISHVAEIELEQLEKEIRKLEEDLRMV